MQCRPVGPACRSDLPARAKPGAAIAEACADRHRRRHEPPCPAHGAACGGIGRPTRRTLPPLSAPAAIAR